MSPPSRTVRREAYFILAMTVLGAVVRLWSADRLGLSHFDEGIYARAGYWAYSPEGYAGVGPGVLAYAPPGYPLLIGVAYLAFGPSDLAAIGVSLACGILTIPVVGWLGRRTFGPGAGAAASALASLCGPHVVFSRMALTDSPFLLIWLLALGLGARFLERPGVWRAVAFGVSVGLAQGTKYSGWIAGGIVAACAILILSRDWRLGARALGLGIIAAVSASIVYLPWYLFIEAHGGYERLLAHQRGYLGGWSSWWPHWKLQMAQSFALSNGETWFNLSMALAVGGLIALGHVKELELRRYLRPFIGLMVLAAPAFVMTLEGQAWWIGVGWVPGLILEERPARKILGVWWLVLAVLTPFYHPYARLWLPLQAAGWLLVAGLLMRVIEPEITGSRPRWRLVVAMMIAVSVALGLALNTIQFPERRPLKGVLGPTDGLRRFVEQEVFPKSSPKGRAVIRTFVSPAFSYYLAGHATILPQEGPVGAIPPPDSDEWGMIDESLIPDEAERRALRGQLVRGEPFKIRYSPATLLDVDPHNAYGPRADEGRVIWLFRPRSTPR